MHDKYVVSAVAEQKNKPGLSQQKRAIMGNC